MQWVHWTLHDDVALPQGAILIEGLPGIGHVGQLVAQHIVDTLGGKLHAELHSPDFPPQALVEDDGTARLVGLRLWAVPATDGAPLIVLTGDTQPMSPHGQFEVTREVLDKVQANGTTTLYTLGGISAAADATLTVVGAATDVAMVERLKEAGAHFDGLGPDGGIIGASGVFLGLARLRGMAGGCLMGESDGGLVDTDAAQRVLAVLGKILRRDISPDGLEEGARRIEVQLQMLDEVRYFAAPTDAEHHYIG